ncbi:MAG: MFS transporter [Deltaproteobacteria bacterium]|nr:MFS transporter [Deltaproteobacteria bacterium]
MNLQNKTQHISLFSYLFFANFLYFFSRMAMSVAAPELIRQGLTEAEMGVILSAFFWGYVIMQIPGGILAQRFGGKRVLYASMLLSALLSAFTPLSMKVWVMSTIRGLTGVAQGPYFPCATNIVSRISKPEHVARIQGFILSGAHIGILTALPIGAWVIGKYGWASIFYLTALLSLIWCVLLIVSTRTISITGSQSKTAIPWRTLLTDRSNLGLTISYFSHNYAVYFFMAWLPTYLMQVHGFSLLSMGFVAIIPSFAAFIFVNVSGWLSDFLVKKGMPTTRSRLFLIYAGMGSAALSIALIPLFPSAFAAVLLITISQAMRSISTPMYWALTIDLAGSHAGILASIMNTSGNFAGVVAPMASGFIVAYFASWNMTIYVCSLVLFLGIVVIHQTIGRRRISYQIAID